MDDALAFQFDHAVVLVPGLGAARRAWGEAGFDVVPGGRHEGSPTENALVAFSDSSYVELLAPRSFLVPAGAAVLRSTTPGLAWIRSRPGFLRRVLSLTGVRRGFVDWAVGTSDVAAAVAAARERGLAIGDPVAMGRTRPDGERLEWKVAFPDSPWLPFLIEDVTPRERRVPAGAKHPNGFTGIAALEVSVRDVETAASRFEQLLGLRVARTLSEYGNMVVEKGAAFCAVGGVRVLIVPGRRGRDPHGPTRLWLRKRGGDAALAPEVAREGIEVSA